MKNGRVLINYNICDNAPECSGIAVCPTGALYYDDEAKRIEFDASLCCDCGACADMDGDGCPIGAIMHASDDEDFKRMRAEIDAETRTTAELNVERYGASPIDEDVALEANECETFSSKASGFLLLEFFTDNSIRCLLHSIPIAHLKERVGDFTHKKVFVENSEIIESIKVLKKYELTDLPILMCYKDGKYLGEVVGYYMDKDEDTLVKKLKEFVN